MKRELTPEQAEFLDGILHEMSAECWLEQLQEYVLESSLVSMQCDFDSSSVITERFITLLGTMHVLIFHFRNLAGGYKMS